MDGMAEHLSALDSMFLELEQADDGAHMHIGAALEFAGAPPTIEHLRAQVAQRLPLLPRFSQKLSSTHTSGLSWLTWEPAGDVDVAGHVQHVRLPDPAGREELLEWLSDFWSHRLDRTRPLWEMALIDSVGDGAWALATKTHHCIVDGVGSLDIGDVVLDSEPHPAPREMPPVTRVDNGHGHSWLAPETLLGVARAGVGTLRHPRAAVEQTAAMTELLVREEVIAAPHCSLNQSLGATHHFTSIRFRLDEIKAIKTALGGTVNDVVLALCAGGLRQMLLARGELPPERGLRAQVPVNIRSSAHEHDLGNQLTSLFITLPVAESDPLARYEQVLGAQSGAKGGSQRGAGKGMVELMDALPPAAAGVLGRTLFGHARMFNLTITNVPGPRERRYAFGSRLEEVLPLVPLFAGHAVGIAAVSYADSIVFGLHGDRAAAPDLAELADGIDHAFWELRPSVIRSARRRSASRPKRRDADAQLASSHR
jgi:diacylglycerol O-acyltransferase / wax synthase